MQLEELRTKLDNQDEALADVTAELATMSEEKETVLKEVRSLIADKTSLERRIAEVEPENHLQRESMKQSYSAALEKSK